MIIILFCSIAISHETICVSVVIGVLTCSLNLHSIEVLDLWTSPSCCQITNFSCLGSQRLRGQGGQVNLMTVAVGEKSRFDHQFDHHIVMTMTCKPV